MSRRISSYSSGVSVVVRMRRGVRWRYVEFARVLRAPVVTSTCARNNGRAFLQKRAGYCSSHLVDGGGRLPHVESKLTNVLVEHHLSGSVVSTVAVEE